MAYVTDDEAERIAGYRQQQGLASKPAPAPAPDPFANWQDTVDIAPPAVYGPFRPSPAPAPSYSLTGPSFDSFNVGNQMGPFEPYDLGFEQRGQQSPVLFQPEPEPFYDPRGAAFQASQRSQSNPFLEDFGASLQETGNLFADRTQRLPGLVEGLGGMFGFGGRAGGLPETEQLGEIYQKDILPNVSGNEFIRSFTPYEPENLPGPLPYLTDALAPINFATAGIASEVPVLGALFKGPYAKNLAAEIGIDIGARALGEQAGGERGASIPLFGDQPAWLRQTEGSLLGGLGVAGAIKGADAGIPAIPGLARQLDAGVNRLDDTLAGGYYGALGMDETLTPGTFRGAGSQVGATGESGMVFRTGRRANVPERTVVPDSKEWFPSDVQKQIDALQAEQGRLYETGQEFGRWKPGAFEQWEDVQRKIDSLRAGAGGDQIPAPLANERLWFHSTRDMKYDLPDPDLAVGTQTGITQGPGIYMAADPAKSAGNYGPRTFVTEFDGKVLDLTKQVTPDAPVFEGGPSWETIRQWMIADSTKRGHFGTVERLERAFDPKNLDAAQYGAHAELAAVARNADGSYTANGYVYRQALMEASPYHDADSLGRFAGVARPASQRPTGPGAEALAYINNTLAENGVDALFHHSPRADGDVLIVLNGNAARVVADVKNAPDAVKAGSTLKEIEARTKTVQTKANQVVLEQGKDDWIAVRTGKDKLWQGLVRESEDGTWEANLGGRTLGKFATQDEAVAQFTSTRLPEIRTFRDLIDDETGSVNIGMFAEAGPVARKRILDQLADRATREGRPTGGIFDDILPTEKIETGIIRTYEGRTGTAGLELQRDLDNGNRLLQDLRIGRRNGRLVNVKRSPEVEGLFKALHGEGDVPPRLQQVYDDVKRMIAAESEATLRDNPEFVMKDDYFYRGWRAPKETKSGVGRGQVGAKPGYQKPRVDATFSELLDEGWEPLSWNPYEMAALRRNAGVQFREQKKLVEAFKKTGLAVTIDAATPDGYRVPRIGPAFEGKPFAFIPGAEPLSDAVGARVGYTPRYAVPNKVADQLENIFGRKPDSGAFLSSWAKGNAKLKQFKLLFSLFQQVDFATRQGAAGFAGAVDDLLSGKPLSAVRKAISIPTDSAKLFTANVSGARQASLRDSILSPKPLFNERPGVSLRSISDAGWSTSDISIINTSIKRALDDIAKGGDVGPVKGALRNVEGEGRLVGAPMRRWKALNEASQKGLFEGVYPQAQVTALKKFIVPRIMRQHPDWTDVQISAASATEVNKMFSTLGNFQQVIKNPVSSEFVKSMVFSTNETESLFKQAASTVIGPNKRLWTEYYIGGFVFLAAVANLVHFAATGEPLPMERYKPIKKDGYGPLPVGYNSQFLSPQIPGLRGRNDTPIDVDLMGQMDTVFRLLDPQGFIEARENVGLRALQSQQSGEDFFGRPLEGPKERIGQLAADLAEPISASQFRGALDIGPEGEGRLGNVGQALQGTGINLRGETTANLKDRKAAEFRDGATWEQLSPRERMELIARDEGLRKELEARRDEAASSGQEWATNQQRVAKRTEELTNFQLGSDKLLADRAITGGAWRSDNSDRKNELWIRKDEIYDFAGTEPGGDPVLDKYYRWIDQSKGPDGEPNWDQVERKVEALPASQQKYIEDNTGLMRIITPQVIEFEAEKAKVEKSGYFDRSEESWQNVQYYFPDAKKYDSYEQWQGAYRKWLVDGWVKDYGMTPELAQREATKYINDLPEAKAMEGYSKQWRYEWAVANPEAAYLAWKWDYYTPTDEMATWLDQVNR